jgi:hypothetical protein
VDHYALYEFSLILNPKFVFNSPIMKSTGYFRFTKLRSDRVAIKDEWILQCVKNPAHQEIQSDGRIRRWAKIDEMGGKFLRVVLLSDGETIHNAFFDRNFKGKKE